MYSFSICEASDSVRDSLETIIRCYFSTKGIGAEIRCFSTPIEMLEHPATTDVLFLDFDSNKDECILAARRLMRQNPGMILFVLSDKYLYLDEAMDLNAFRYLSKNLDVNRIITSLDALGFPDIELSFMSNYTLMEMKESEIACIYSQDRRTMVLTGSGECYPTILSIKNWLCKLSDSRNFVHPHYSYIVNKSHIHSFNGEFITVLCEDGKTMSVYPSQRRISQLKDSLAVNISR